MGALHVPDCHRRVFSAALSWCLTSAGGAHVRADPASLSHFALRREGAPAARFQATVLAFGDDSAGDAQAGPGGADRRLSEDPGVAGRRRCVLRYRVDRPSPGAGKGGSGAVSRRPGDGRRELRPVGRCGAVPARGKPGVRPGVHRRAFRQAAAGIPQGLHGRSQPAIQRRQRRPPAAGTGAPPVAGIHGATGAPVVARGRRFPVRRSVRRRLRRGALPVVPQGHAGHSAAGRRLPAGAGLVGTGARLRPWRASRDECGGSPGGGSRQPARGIAGRILQRPQRFPARPGGRHRRHRLRCRRGTGRTALRRQRGTHPAPRNPRAGTVHVHFPRLGFRIEAR